MADKIMMCQNVRVYYRVLNLIQLAPDFLELVFQVFVFDPQGTRLTNCAIPLCRYAARFNVAGGRLTYAWVRLRQNFLRSPSRQN